MPRFISDRVFEPKTFGLFTLVDYRTLNTADKNRFASIVNATVRTAIPSIICGAEGTESIALEMENARVGGMGPEDINEFIAQYRASFVNRATTEQLEGAGMLKFALYRNGGVMGAVFVKQTSIVERIGSLVRVKITPLVHRQGVRVLNAAGTAFTANWISDQASFIRYALNNTFNVEDSSIVVEPVLCDSHPRNTMFETWRPMIDYDAALTIAMSAFAEITTVPLLEGARHYNGYAHV